MTAISGNNENEKIRKCGTDLDILNGSEYECFRETSSQWKRWDDVSV